MLKVHEIERHYLALVRGATEHRDFSVDAPLGRRADRVVVDHAEGRDAETGFRVRERMGHATLLEAIPRTGRTHQIRAHLRAIGHPILGRPVATGAGATTRRRSASRGRSSTPGASGSIHPLTGERIDREEPLPEDLDTALELARDRA